MLPPSYSDHDPTPPPSFDSLALLFSHYPIITQLAKLVTTGDLIQLSRTSSTIREALQQSRSYWEQLMSLTTLVCSEPGHIKGDKVKACVVCTMPVCETCIVKSDFFGTSNIFSNRIRSFCDSCWSATNFPATTALPLSPQVCVCVVKDGWLCAACRVVERAEFNDNKAVCATDGCDNPHQASEKQRVCTWCRMPRPPAWWVQTADMVAAPHASGEDDAPEYRPRVEEEDEDEVHPGEETETEGPLLGGPAAGNTDKVRVAGWDKMDEAERKDYQEAWLKKGAREREAGPVYRARGGDISSAPAGDEEVPEFADEDYAELGESSEAGAAGGR